MKKENKILNLMGEKFTPEARSVLDSVAEVDYITPTQEQLADMISKYDAVLLGLEVRFDAKVLENASKLKFIATATTGLDHIDIAYAESRGVKVLSLKGENAFLDTVTGTAELAFGLILSLVRFIPYSFEDVKKGNWNREVFRGRSLYGKTLGIVGLGRLGKMMANYGKAFGMKVLFVDPNVKAQDFPEYEKVDLRTLISESDVVSVHVHLTQETENMFDGTVFKRMKKSAYLINTSRGKIVNEIDLVDALKNKIIAGYGADVLANELAFQGGAFSGNMLIDYMKSVNNVIVLPHIGGMTHESREATDMFIAKKIETYIKSL